MCSANRRSETGTNAHTAIHVCTCAHTLMTSNVYGTVWNGSGALHLTVPSVWGVFKKKKNYHIYSFCLLAPRRLWETGNLESWLTLKLSQLCTFPDNNNNIKPVHPLHKTLLCSEVYKTKKLFWPMRRDTTKPFCFRVNCPFNCVCSPHRDGFSAVEDLLVLCPCERGDLSHKGTV